MKREDDFVRQRSDLSSKKGAAAVGHLASAGREGLIANALDRSSGDEWLTSCNKRKIND
jgi:hypothetical protein